LVMQESMVAVQKNMGPMMARMQKAIEEALAELEKEAQ